MPTIIDDPRGKLIAEARRQIETVGYSAMTVRSVARECGLGVGTVYNYFPSKDALVASFMLEDWRECMTAVAEVGETAHSARPVVRCIYDQLRLYAARHEGLFRDSAAAAAFAGAFSRYHAMLRAQLSAPLRPYCADGFTADFAAEALLTWTMAGAEFDALYDPLSRVLETKK